MHSAVFAVHSGETMKTLRAFWHWVDNEKPAAELYAEKASDTLSELAYDAILEAERLVCVRAGAGSVQVFDHATEDEHRHLRPALRDLSLALCAALEHMHGQVEDDYLGKRYPARPDFQTHANAGDHATPGSFNLLAIDELADWLPAPRACDGPLQGKRVTQADLDRVNAQMRGSLGFAQHEVGSGWAKMQQLANMPGRPIPALRGQIRSYYEEGKLTIFTTVTVAELDQFRGLAPRSIIILGEPTDYGQLALAYLPEIIAPMLDRAVINTPCPAMAAWCKGKLWP
jgi:hypothetical protein